MPSFHFVSLAPKRAGNDLRVYETMVIGHDVFSKVLLTLPFINRMIIAKGKAMGCQVSVGPFAGNWEREIGLRGLAKEVESTRVLIQKIQFRVDFLGQTAETINRKFVSLLDSWSNSWSNFFGGGRVGKARAWIVCWIFLVLCLAFVYVCLQACISFLDILKKPGSMV
jgi:hypothetical protein